MAEITIAGIRKDYPQYDDMSDDQLSDALHQKFYPDMNRSDFRRRIGMPADLQTSLRPVARPEVVEPTVDPTQVLARILEPQPDAVPSVGSAPTQIPAGTLVPPMPRQATTGTPVQAIAPQAAPHIPGTAPQGVPPVSLAPNAINADLLAALTGGAESLDPTPGAQMLPVEPYPVSGVPGGRPQVVPLVGPRPAPQRADGPNLISIMGGGTDAATMSAMEQARRMGLEERNAPPEAPDPFAGEGAGPLLKRRGQEVAQGASGVLQSVARARGINDKTLHDAIQRDAPDRVKEAARQASRFEEILTAGVSDDGISPLTGQELETYQRRLIEAQTAISQWADVAEFGPTFAGNRGEKAEGAAKALKDWTDETFGVPPKDDTLWSELAYGTGSMIGFVIPSVVAGPAGVLVTAQMGADAAKTEAYDRAIQSGASERDAQTAAAIMGFLGTAEALPIAAALNRLPAPLRRDVIGRIGRFMSHTFKGSIEEGIQEGGLAIAQNLTEAGVYNPDRQIIDKEVGHQALIGMILGGFMGGGANMLGAGRPSAVVQKEPDDPEAPRQSLMERGRGAVEELKWNGPRPRRPEPPRNLTDDDIAPPIVTPPQQTVDERVDDKIRPFEIGEAPVEPTPDAQPVVDTSSPAAPSRATVPVPESFNAKGWRERTTPVGPNGKPGRVVYENRTTGEVISPDTFEAWSRGEAFVRPPTASEAAIASEESAQPEAGFEVVPETETIDGETLETGRNIRINLATGEATVVEDAVSEPVAPAPEVLTPTPTPKRKPRKPRPAELQKRPFTYQIKQIGIHPDGPVAAELAKADITPRTTPGLFTRNGAKNLDNLPAVEWADIAHEIGADDSGTYLSEQGIIDAIIRENSGTPLQGPEQADLQAAQDSEEAYERFLSSDYDAEELAVVDTPPFVASPDMDMRSETERRDDVKPMLDETIQGMGLTGILTQEEYSEATEQLVKNGGDVEELLYAIGQRGIERAETTSDTEFDDFIPFFDHETEGVAAVGDTTNGQTDAGRPVEPEGGRETEAGSAPDAATGQGAEPSPTAPTPEPTPEVETEQVLPHGIYGTPDKPLKFISGMSRTKDFTQVIEAGKNVGITINELSDPGIDAIAAALAKGKGWVFVDTGAFTLFMADLRAKQANLDGFKDYGGKGMDFDKIIARFEKLHLAIAKADPSGFASERVLFVMPDIVGDQKGSLNLVKDYADVMNDYSKHSIVPLQSGDLTLKEAFEVMMGNLGLDPKTDISPIIGVPSRAAAVSDAEFRELMREYGGNIGGVHILGAVADKTLSPRLTALREEGFDGNTSADANRLRSLLNGNHSRAETMRKMLYEGGLDKPLETEQTPEGEQFAMPGMDTVQTSKAQDDAAEIGARQQQGKMGRLDQERVEDDDGGLFGGAQGGFLAADEDATNPNEGTPAEFQSKMVLPFVENRDGQVWVIDHYRAKQISHVVGETGMGSTVQLRLRRFDGDKLRNSTNDSFHKPFVRDGKLMLEDGWNASETPIEMVREEAGQGALFDQPKTKPKLTPAFQAQADKTAKENAEYRHAMDLIQSGDIAGLLDSMDKTTPNAVANAIRFSLDYKPQGGKKSYISADDATSLMKKIGYTSPSRDAVEAFVRENAKIGSTQQGDSLDIGGDPEMQTWAHIYAVKKGWNPFKGSFRKPTEEFKSWLAEGAPTPATPTKAEVADAAADADTNPTDGQKEAGNYELGHIAWNGLDISIENAKGSERSGTDSDGETWSVTMPAHYGYIKRTEGADGDHVDVYIGDMPDSDNVVIVNQIDPATGKFDEHKVILGTGSTAAALRIYEGGFSDGSGKARNGSHSATSVEGFKNWLKDSDTTKPTHPVKKVTAPEDDAAFVPWADSKPGDLVRADTWVAARNISPKIVATAVGRFFSFSTSLDGRNGNTTALLSASKPDLRLVEWAIETANAEYNKYKGMDGAKTEGGRHVIINHMLDALKSGTPPKKVTTPDINSVSAETFKNWGNSVSQVGSVSKWKIFDDTEVGTGFMLMSNNTMVGPFDTVQAAQTWAKDGNPAGSYFEGKKNAAPEAPRVVEAETPTRKGGSSSEADTTAKRKRASNKSAMNESEKLRLAEIKARFTNKIKNQTSAGLDPELVSLAVEAAGIYIKAGARSFKDFILDMSEDFGLPVQLIGRYARIAYNDVRDEMETNGDDVSGMDDSRAVIATLRDLNNAASTISGLEPDSGNADTSDTVGETDVSPAGRGDGAGVDDGGGSTGTGSGKRKAGGGVSTGNASTVGASGTGSVSGAKRANAKSANDRDSAGGRDSGQQGFFPDTGRPEETAQYATDNADLAGRAEQQAKADKIKVKPLDEANIRATLPLLLPEQQDDVLKIEKRFAAKDGHGMLITNGTGTGKTYTGMGAIKRFAQQGKENTLILAPTQGILDQWIEAGADMGLTITKLEDTTDAGTGIVATTYANAGENNVLATRDWDLVVPDESQKLSANKAGAETDALNAMRAITNKPSHVAERFYMINADEIAKLHDMKDGPEKTAKWHNLMERRRAYEAVQATKPRSKVLFLSATPFAVDKSTDYAEGYLFDYGAGGTTDTGSRQGGREFFFVENFGYRIRHHKLTKPEAAVDSGVFEREFHEKLKSTGALSGRSLNIDADYDRKFATVHSGIGTEIDEVLEWLNQQKDGEGSSEYDALKKMINGRFNWLKRMQFLEAIKARESVDDIKSHLKLGRKVVVFYDFNKGGGINPFNLADTVGEGEPGWSAYQSMVEAFPKILDWKFHEYKSPIETLLEAFPDQARQYNGKVSRKQRAENKTEFNKDDSGVDVILVQSAAGEAGVSLHDTTGKHQRVLINLGMPVRPTTTLQEEGRVYRVGNASNAAYRYYTTGTAWERSAFAGSIAEKSGTVENLALGNEARSIRESFIDAYMEASELTASENDGVGGKERDRAVAQTTPWDQAKTHYYGRMKTSGKRDQRAGVDFYSTPEPVGLKMVEWAGLRTYERVLEPSAGDGAIARYFPDDADRTVIEPSLELNSRVQLRTPGAKAISERFEDHNLVNKYNAVVMNPPYGAGGKTAIEHLSKAARHLKDGGRIVALIPTGPSADKHFQKWFFGEKAAKNLVMSSEVKLPASTFEKAGTKVMTRIVVIDRIDDHDLMAEQHAERKHIDLTGADSVAKLFDRIENLGAPTRIAATEAIDVFDDVAEAIEAARPDVQVDVGGFTTGETVHAKNGKNLWVATQKTRVDKDTFKAIVAVARSFGGYYSPYRAKGAIAGYQFESAQARADFIDAIENTPVVSKDQRQAPADMFYSALLRGIEGAKQKQATGKDWKAIIPKLGGIKAAEIEWLGVNDWLDAQTGQVTRDDLAAFVRGSQIEIVEEVGTEYAPDIRLDVDVDGGSDNGYTEFTIYDDVVSRGRWEMEGLLHEDGEYTIEGETFGSREEVFDWAEKTATTANADFQASHEGYTEQGGENYREVLLRVPNLHESGKNTTLTQRSAKVKLDNLLAGRRMIDLEGDEATLAESLSLEANRYGRNDRISPFVQSGHFEQENIVVHARMKDRRGRNGEKVLFVEEIQSDLASKWRESSEPAEVTAQRRELGDKVDKQFADLQKMLAESPAWENERAQAKSDGTIHQLNLRPHSIIEAVPVADMNQAGGVINSGFSGVENRAVAQVILDTEGALEAGWAALDSRKELLLLGSEKKMDQSTPDTPFQQEHTYTLMVKRLLRMAAEGGYDRLSWTPGYMQAERWNAAAQSVVEGVDWDSGYFAGYPEAERVAYLDMGGDGGAKAVYIRPGGTIIYAEGLPDATDKPLSTLLGPNLAGQILSEDSGHAKSQKITFPDSGYAIAYDQQTKRAVDKLAKKSGARVYVDKTLPDFWLPPENGYSELTNPVWSIDINDKLRTSAMQPMAVLQVQPVGEAMAAVQANLNIGTIMPDLRADLDRMNLKRVNLGADMSGKDRQGAFEVNILGNMRILIGQALNPGQTLHHEALHAMRAMNLFTAGEWRVLEVAAARKWVEKHNIVARYPDLLPSEQIEEAIAEEFAEAVSEKKSPSDTFIRRAFQKIDRFLKSMASALRGNGFQTVEDVFGRAAGGEVGARDQQSNTDGPAFKEWFGDSKVVDKNGNPLVVYHGTSAEFDTFDASRGEDWRGGLFFTKSKKKADVYGDKTMSVYLSLKNPKIVNQAKVSLASRLMTPAKAKRETSKRLNEAGAQSQLTPAAIAKLKEQGFDGIVNNARDEILVFDADQIRAAGKLRVRNQAEAEAVRRERAKFNELMDELDTGEFDDKAPARAFEQMKKLSKSRDAMAEALAKLPGGVELSGTGRTKTVVTKSQDGGKGWRITYFDDNGFSGHGEYASKKAALSEAIKEGNDVVDTGSLRKAVKSGTFFERTIREQRAGGGIEAFERNLKDRLGLRDLSLSKSGNDLKINMIAVKKGEQKSGTGTQAMQAITEFADANNMRVILSPGLRDDGFGTTSRARLVKFYKRFGFVENKGRNKDFAISAGMFRDPIRTKVKEQRKVFNPVTTAQGRAHRRTAMQGSIFIPDRRIWEELTDSSQSYWSRLGSGAGAAHDWIDKARIKIQDRFLPVLRAQEAVIRTTGGPLSEDMNVYLAEETFSGKVGRHLFEIDEQFTKPIIDLIAGTKGALTADDVGMWLTARHAVERNARIASINLAMPDKGSGITTANANAIMAQGAAGPHAQMLNEIGALIDQLREKTLKMREDSGLITSQDAALWRTQYKYYVPLKGFAETDHSEAVLDVTGAGRRFNTRGKETKQAMGRGDSEAFNPLQGAITQAQEVAIRSEKNVVGQKMYELATAHPSKALWSIKKHKQKRYYNKTTGLVETRVEDPVSLFMEPNEMAVKVSGKEVRIVFHDPRMAQALGSVGADQMNGFFQVMSMASRYFSSINTMMSPTFVVRNAIRDMQAAQINIRNFGKGDRNKLAVAMIKNWPKAFAGAYRGQLNKDDSEWTRYYKEFDQSGAKVSFWRMEQPEAEAQDMNRRIKMAGGTKLGKASRFLKISTRDNPILGFIERTNLAVDNAIRLAAYVEARKLGWTKADAASLSKNMTVNFNRRGEWGAWLNALYPFANAGIQGTQILFRAMTTKRMAKYAIGLVGLGMLADQVGSSLSHMDDDDELAYDKIENWKLQTSLVVMLGPDAEDAYNIWMPYGYSLFPYLGTQLSKVSRGVKPVDEAMADFAAAIFGSFSPLSGGTLQQVLTPTMLDPINEMAQNKDWLGRPIRPENAYADYGPDAYKYYRGSTLTSRKIADAANRATGGTRAERGVIDVSPEYIDHAFGFVTGGMGRFAGQSSDIIAKLFSGRASEIEGRDIPFYRDVRINTGDWMDRNRYYRFRGEVREANDSAKTAVEVGEALSPEATALAGLYDASKAAEKRLRQLRKARNTIEGNTSLTPAMKQAGLEKVEQELQKTYMLFNKIFIKKIGKQGS